MHILDQHPALRLTPFLLNGYPCLLCPCVVCFKFLQPKVIEGKKIDCALADPHLPARLLGGAPQLFTTNLVCLPENLVQAKL